MLRYLQDVPTTQEPTGLEVAKSLSLDPNSSQFLMVLCEASSRLSKLARIAQSLEDTECSATQKRKLVDAVSKIMQFFSPMQQSAPLALSKANFLKSDEVLEIMWFSQVARKIMPLRRISDSNK